MNDKEMERQIKAMNWNDLTTNWRNRNSKEIKGKWESGKFFEYSILRAFEIEGAEVRYPYTVSYFNGSEIREQIDGAIHVEGLSIIVESKDLKKNIDVEPLAKLQVRLKTRPSSVIGCIFCASNFTLAAQSYTETMMPQTILLWSNNDIEYCFENFYFIKGLKLKYKKVIEDGIHLLDLKTSTFINNEL